MTLRSSIVPFVLGIAIVAAGIFVSGYFRTYQTVPHFDDSMHALGGLVLAWFIAAWFAPTTAKLPRPTAALFVIGTVAIGGILWEIGEFLSGKYLHDVAPIVWRYFRGGNLQDTIGDLSLDLGGALALCLLWFRRRS